MTRILSATLALLTLALAAPPADARKSQEWAWCEGIPGASPDHQIAGCTAVIQAGKEPAINLAIAFNNRGNAYAVKGDHDRAIHDYGSAITLVPVYAEAFYNRGLAFGAKGAYADAILDFDQVIALFPGAPDAYNSRCWTRARAGKQLEVALADCDAALKMRPGHPATLDARAFVHYRLGDTDAAIADCDAALAAEPGFASSLFVRGLAKLQDDDETGQDDIAAAKKIDPNIQKEYARYGVTTP